MAYDYIQGLANALEAAGGTPYINKFGQRVVPYKPVMPESTMAMTYKEYTDLGLGSSYDREEEKRAIARNIQDPAQRAAILADFEGKPTQAQVLPFSAGLTYEQAAQRFTQANGAPTTQQTPSSLVSRPGPAPVPTTQQTPSSLVSRPGPAPVPTTSSFVQAATTAPRIFTGPRVDSRTLETGAMREQGIRGRQIAEINKQRQASGKFDSMGRQYSSSDPRIARARASAFLQMPNKYGSRTRP